MVDPNFRSLDPDALWDLADALFALDLDADGRRRLLARLPRTLAASLPPASDGPGSLAQIELDLDRLNRIERLRDGEVPLDLYLQGAQRLARGRGGDVVTAIEQARARVATGDGPRAAAAPDTPERVIDFDARLDVAFLAAGARAAESVGLVRVPALRGGAPLLDGAGNPIHCTGTAWVVAPGLLLTNHHVVRVLAAAEPVSDADLHRQVEAAQVTFHPDGVDAPADAWQPVAGLRAAAPAPLDYAVLAVDTARPPLPLRTAPFSVERFSVNIIQYPLRGAEQRKLVSLRNNLAVEMSDEALAYLTDTSFGASGAPACDDAWQVVALHRAASATQRWAFNGRQLTYVNLGTPIPALLAGLAARHPDVRALIPPAAAADRP